MRRRFSNLRSQSYPINAVPVNNPGGECVSGVVKFGAAWRNVCACVVPVCVYGGVFASDGATTHSLCGLEVTVSTMDRVGVDILLFSPSVCLVQQRKRQ